jgi:hypothetical protein
MSTNVFHGPETLNILSTAVGDGWRVDPKDDESGVTFLYHYPGTPEDRQPVLDLAQKIMILSDVSYPISIEGRESDIKEVFSSWFVLDAAWPIPDKLMITLDEIAQDMHEYWIKSQDPK